MGFSTYGQKSTKASDTYVSTTAFNLNDVIGVFGFYTQSADWSASSPVNFMFNEDVVREAYEWTYDPVKYWPNVTGEKLSFWGYYPQGCTSLTFYDSSDNEYANTAVGLPAKAVFTQEDDAKDHIDLMFSKFENGYERNLTKPAVDALVNLRFTHALSQLRFEFEAMPSGMSVEITALSISNMRPSGTLVINAADPTAYSGRWTPSGARQAFVCTDFSTADKAAFLVVPQSLEDATPANEPAVTVTYNLVTTAADGSDDVKYTGMTGTAKLKTVTLTSLDPGKIYTWVMRPSFDPIEFSEVFTEDWVLSTPNINL